MGMHLRLGTAPGSQSTPKRVVRRIVRGISTASRRLFVRLMAASLVITVAVMSAVVVVLTDTSSGALVSSTTAHLQDLARSATSRLDAWVQLTQSELSEWAEGLGTSAASRSGLGSVLRQYFNQTESVFGELDLVDASGNLVASSRQAGTPSYPGLSSLGAGGLGVTVLPIQKVGGAIQWYAIAPVNLDAARFTGYLVGDINTAQELTQVFDSVIASTSSPIVVQAVAADHRLVFSSAMAATSPTAMAQAGALTQVVQSPAVDDALQTGMQPGTVTYGQGAKEAIAGYVHDQSLGWAIVATEPASVALAPVKTGQSLATLMLVGAVILTALVMLLVSFLITRPIGRMVAAARSVTAGNLSTRVRTTGTVELAALANSFNLMVESLATLIGRMQRASADLGESASKLSATSSQLATTTTQQSAAAAETSASMEELARTSARIAESIEQVAARASLTQENLQQAQYEIRATSERTVALSRRVREITAILTMINDIAEATNLLAFNAAIEAARAGTAGRGFGVLADEVRRLAERTKQMAAEIGEITQGAQAETAATVMAMEKGVNQLVSGLRLMEEVAEASSQVRLATVEQRSASDHVVEAMEQVSSASRQLSTTSQEIARAASSHAVMAGDLQEAATVSGV